jgi:CelD/BcsL family acetyltransferase involved in cellulose biosynthesis
MREHFDIRLIRDTYELHELEPQWSSLWRTDLCATPFQSPEWLLPWWRQFGQPELRTLAICERGSLIGLLPFYIYREPVSDQRQMLLMGAGTSDYLDGIFSARCTEAHLHAALEILRREDDWDRLIASQLRPESKLYQALAATPGARPFEAEHCAGMAASPIESLPLKIRRNAMYYRNRAQRLGSLEFVVADRLSWPVIFDDLQRLHTHRWKSRGEPGVLSDPRVLAWHMDSIPKLLEAGTLRLCSLRLNGESIGVLYSLVDLPAHQSRTQYFYLTAYSIAHAELRPGTLLLAFAIEHAASEGIRRIDMLRGDEAYKRLWHLERVPTFGFALNSQRSLASAEPARAA